MPVEHAKLLAESIVLPLTTWVRMVQADDGAFYAVFLAGSTQYALMMGPGKVREGIRLASKELLPPPLGDVLAFGKKSAPGGH